MIYSEQETLKPENLLGNELVLLGSNYNLKELLNSEVNKRLNTSPEFYNKFRKNLIRNSLSKANVNLGAVTYNSHMGSKNLNINEVYNPNLTEISDPNVNEIYNPVVNDVYNQNEYNSNSDTSNDSSFYTNKELLGADEVRCYLKEKIVGPELLGSNEFDNMNDTELLGFTKAITNENAYILPYLIKGSEVQTITDFNDNKDFLKNLLIHSDVKFLPENNDKSDIELLGFFKKLWKGIKKGVSSVGKFIGKAGKSIVKGVGKIGKGVWNVAKNVGKGIIKGVGSVAKFVGKNAGGLLKAGLSFLPGGSIVSSLIDNLMPGKDQEQNTDQGIEQRNYYPEQIPEQLPQQREYSTYPQYDPNISQNEVIDYNNNYSDAGDQNFVYVNEYGEQVDENGELLGENIFQKIGKFTKKLSDPLNQRKIANVLNTSADVETMRKERMKVTGLLSDQQQKESVLRYKTEAISSGIFNTYGIYIALGLVAFIFLTNKK